MMNIFLVILCINSVIEATMKGKAIEENQNASSCVSASRFSRLSDRLEEKYVEVKAAITSFIPP